jgi:hypothetical protein
MIPVRSIITNNVARFQNVLIHNLADTKVEVFTVGDENYLMHIGKNSKKLIDVAQVPNEVDVQRAKLGNYYYWYTLPLHNYYHCILDGIGQLSWYFELRKQIPNLKLILNATPKPPLVKHPPFVTELLDLFDIEYEYSDCNAIYDTMYFGLTLGQDSKGKRIRPHDRQYELIRELIDRAKARATAPQFDRIYLSRRAHANPLNNRKDIIGEDNTVKRGITNEDEIVDILSSLGYTEVFGENYTLAEKIVLFNGMKKYISSAGAGVTNIVWTMPNPVSVGGIHSPGFGFPIQTHGRHMCVHPDQLKATINCYPGKVCFVDEKAGAKDYNSPWYVNNLEAFRKWAATI